MPFFAIDSDLGYRPLLLGYGPLYGDERPEDPEPDNWRKNLTQNALKNLTAAGLIREYQLLWLFPEYKLTDKGLQVTRELLFPSRPRQINGSGRGQGQH